MKYYFLISVPGYNKPKKFKHLKIGTLLLIEGKGTDNKYAYTVVEFQGNRSELYLLSANQLISGFSTHIVGSLLMRVSKKLSISLIKKEDLLLYMANPTERFEQILKGD